MVTLICGSSSRGVTSTANNPSSTATNASSGVICECRKCLAMRPEIPMFSRVLVGCAMHTVVRETHPTVSVFQIPLLQLFNTQSLQYKFFVNRIRSAFFDFADEIFFEGDLGYMHPFSAGEPGHVARRNLRHRYEGDPAI